MNVGEPPLLEVLDVAASSSKTAQDLAYAIPGDLALAIEATPAPGIVGQHELAQSFGPEVGTTFAPLEGESYLQNLDLDRG